MDNIDAAILRRLSADARVKYSEMSDELGVATSTVLNRIHRLEAEGIIERFTIVVNPAKTGKGTTTYVGINVERDKKDAVVEKIKKITDVLELYELLEPYDLLIKVRTEDMNSLKENVLHVISEMDGVLDLSSILTTKRHKEISCNIH